MLEIISGEGFSKIEIIQLIALDAKNNILKFYQNRDRFGPIIVQQINPFTYFPSLDFSTTHSYLSMHSLFSQSLLFHAMDSFHAASFYYTKDQSPLRTLPLVYFYFRQDVSHMRRDHTNKSFSFDSCGGFFQPYFLSKCFHNQPYLVRWLQALLFGLQPKYLFMFEYSQHLDSFTNSYVWSYKEILSLPAWLLTSLSFAHDLWSLASFQFSPISDNYIFMRRISLGKLMLSARYF